MNKPKPETIVKAFLDCIAARDFDGARLYLANDSFSSRSPLSTYNNADAFMANISRIGPILEGIEVRKTFVDGNEVCSIFNMRTRMTELNTTPVVQLANVVDGKIVTIESFFDASEYIKMFDVD